MKDSRLLSTTEPRNVPTELERKERRLKYNFAAYLKILCKVNLLSWEVALEDTCNSGRAAIWHDVVSSGKRKKKVLIGTAG